MNALLALERHADLGRSACLVLFLGGLFFFASPDETLGVVTTSAGYRFTLVASSDGEFRIIDSQLPLMLEDGSVLFQGSLKTNVEVLAISNGEPLTTVTSWTGAPRTGVRHRMLGAQHVNATSEVTFFGNRPNAGSLLNNVYHWTSTSGLQSLYRSDGAAADTFSSFRADPSINSAGQVAFVASGQGLPTAIFVGDNIGTRPTALASSGGPLYEGFDSSFNHPQILDDGTVIAIGRKNSVNGIHRFTAPGVSTPIFEENPTMQLLGEFDTNRAGTITFASRSTDAGMPWTVFAGDEHGLTPVFVETAQFSPVRTGINDFAQVLIAARDKTLVGDQDVLFLGSDPLGGRVVGTGDLLLDQTVLALFAGPGSLNNHGQIAFWAIVRDPLTLAQTSGIYIATPVPEPTTANLVLIAIAPLLWRRAKRDERYRTAATTSTTFTSTN